VLKARSNDSQGKKEIAGEGALAEIVRKEIMSKGRGGGGKRTKEKGKKNGISMQRQRCSTCHQRKKTLIFEGTHPQNN